MQTEISQPEREAGVERKDAPRSQTESSLVIRLANQVPYRLGLWILRQTSRSWLFQRTFFRQYGQRLKPILALAEQPVDHNRAVRRHLMGVAYKSIRQWRRAAVERGDGEALRKFFPITGLDKFDRARANGRGLILVSSHFGGGRFVPVVLAQIGIELLSLERVNGFEKLGVKLPDTLHVIRLRNSFLARAVFEAQKSLKQGKVVHLAADGHRGSSGFVLTFHGRQRPFAASFAELAVNTGAVVMPVFAPFDEEGRVNIELLDPLDSGDDSISHGERIKSLVKQYVRLLEQRWCQDPGNVLQGHVEGFLRWPVEHGLGSTTGTESETNDFEPPLRPTN